MVSLQLDFAAEAYELVNSTHNNEELLKALRCIKNCVIGNPTRKKFFLEQGISNRLYECLVKYQANPVLVKELAPIIGSLAQFDSKKLVSSGILAPLFDCLKSEDQKVVECCARAVRAVVHNPNDLNDNVISPEHIRILLNLAGGPLMVTPKYSIAISEICIMIICRLAEKESTRIEISHCDGISVLVEWLNEKWDLYPKVQESSIDALASICRGNHSLASLIGQSKLRTGQTVFLTLFKLLGDKRTVMRLSAASCLAQLYNARAIPGEFEMQIYRQLLPAIIRLFDEDQYLIPGVPSCTVQEKSLLLFSFLIVKDPKLQSKALECDAISKLAAILRVCVVEPSSGLLGKDNLAQAAFNAVAAVSSLTEECRRQVIELKLLPTIVIGLTSADSRVKVAACSCTRSLSRSVKNLRTCLVDVGVAEPLLNMLFDNDIQVQRIASATLCNIVLDFSPMKKIAIDRGVVKQLELLLNGDDKELRLNSGWALKNMLFHADIELKQQIIMIESDDVEFKIQGLNSLRNLLCPGEIDISFVIGGFGANRLMDTIQDTLVRQGGVEAVLLQVVYILVNIAVGNSDQKDLIMSRPALLDNICSLLNHPVDEIKISAIWCIINLTWSEDIGSRGRVEVFRSRKVDLILEEFHEKNTNSNIRDRAHTALINLNGDPMSISNENNEMDLDT